MIPAAGHSSPYPPLEGITRVVASGFKSIADEQSIDIRPLTILAGANSSGKSSMIQPLLLLKQTLEATYDPGALLLDGPNVRFTGSDQILTRRARLAPGNSFYTGIGLGDGTSIAIHFHRRPGMGFSIQSMEVNGRGPSVTLRPDMSQEELDTAVDQLVSPEVRRLVESVVLKDAKFRYELARNRCFLEVRLMLSPPGSTGFAPWPPLLAGESATSFASPGSRFERCLREIIHVAGLRGNPARSYPVTALGSSFAGTGVGPSFLGPFETYTASVIAQWQTDRNYLSLQALNADLRRLALTWKVLAEPVNETQVELRVGRLGKPARGGARDLVNIADVGFGVSQVLPVLVALHVAAPGQLVYLEQPELHLHPRAQYALAELLADAANRGIRIIAETHSSLLLLGIQALVAEGKIDPGGLKLHWFRRRETGPSAGATDIVTADFDEAGAFGDWPEDFADVALMAESRYLDAAESQPAAAHLE